MPWIALMAGLLSHRREGWHDARPPRLLVLGAVALPALMGLVFAFADPVDVRGLSGAALILGVAVIMTISLVALPVTTVTPVSVGARVLVGAHLILSVGWALVLFAAVMSFVQPKLERIARRDAE